MKTSDQILEQLEKKLNNFEQEISTKNIGIVEKNTDGVIVASGLSQAQMGELVEFENGSKGVILNLDQDSVSIILLDKASDIKEGDSVKRTEKLLSIEVSEELFGRVINPLGTPLDGKPQIKKGTLMPLERIAAGVVEREPVDTPLKTGIKAIDAMVPIGRGKRETALKEQRSCLVLKSLKNYLVE
jgi:F-type H+-transporting ATPase subunit alpha